MAHARLPGSSVPYIHEFISVIRILKLTSDQGQALIDEHQTQSLPKPSQNALATFKRYFNASGSILIGHDKKTIEQEEDLIALGTPLEDDRLGKLVRHSCGYCLQVSHPEVYKVACTYSLTVSKTHKCQTPSRYFLFPVTKCPCSKLYYHCHHLWYSTCRCDGLPVASR